MRASLFAAFSLAVLLSSRFSFATPYPYIASILDSGSSTRVTAWGVSGSAQVGHIWIDFFVGPSQAVLWPETSAAPIRLHSSVFSETEVWDISGSARSATVAGLAPAANVIRCSGMARPKVSLTFILWDSTPATPIASPA